jgi:hypothetical protein
MVLDDEAERGLSHPTGPWIVSAPHGVDADDLERRVVEAAASFPELSGEVELPPPFVGAADEPLVRAREIAARPGVAYTIGYQTPILGQAWATVRKTIHDEARLYVDALMARQAELDEAMLAAIEALRAEVVEMRKRLEGQLPD